jgi:hypothetical protein
MLRACSISASNIEPSLLLPIRPPAYLAGDRP